MKSIVVLLMLTVAAQSVSFRAEGARLLYGDEYGSGNRGVVILAHGGYSSRARWKPAAEALEAEGFHLLVFESRGAADYAGGKETPCLGAKTISLIGGSLGGAAVALAAIEVGPKAIDSIVLLAPAAIAAPEKIPTRLLFIAARNDANAAGLRLPGIREQYARVRSPKEFKLVEGSAHGQLILSTPDGAPVIRDIVRFLRSPTR